MYICDTVNTWDPKSDLLPLRVKACFLPCDASAERGDATVSRLSVCLSGTVFKYVGILGK